MRITVQQLADAANSYADQGLLFWLAGFIEQTRDVWRTPGNMDLLHEDAQIAARHYIREANGEK